VLDLDYLRNKPEEAHERMLGRGPEAAGLLLGFQAADEKYRSVKLRLDQARTEKNQLSDQVPVAFKEGRREEANAMIALSRHLGTQITELTAAEKVADRERNDIVSRLPNFPYREIDSARESYTTIAEEESLMEAEARLESGEEFNPALPYRRLLVDRPSVIEIMLAAGFTLGACIQASQDWYEQKKANCARLDAEFDRIWAEIEALENRG
jgi:seryl-tRNA synthetase